MKAFTRTFLFLYLLFSVLVAFPCAERLPRARADDTLPTTGTYACVVEDYAYFYASPDESTGLFLLPTTYYVRLLDYGETLSRVEYFYDGATAKKLVGYAKTSALAFVDYVPVTPYFYYTFDLRYSIGDVTVGDGFLGEITATCTYYGDYNVGSKTYCYVLRDDVFGYVPKPSDLRVKENLEYATYLENQKTDTPIDSQDKPIETPSKSSPAQIAILVVLCLLIPVLATLILRPQKRRRFDVDE